MTFRMITKVERRDPARRGAPGLLLTLSCGHQRWRAGRFDQGELLLGFEHDCQDGHCCQISRPGW